MAAMTAGLAVVGAVLALLAVLLVLGRWRWNGLTGERLSRLAAGQHTPQTVRFDASELDRLPPVVQRYFRVALADGAPIVTTATVDHAGWFNMGESVDRWLPFRSRQQVQTCRPGFVWDGRIRMAPGLQVHVHDAYVDGEGVLHPAIAGLFDLPALRGGGAIAEGELLRFFAEAAWYPTALLPSQGVSWQAIDDRSARATLRDAGLAVSLTFDFDAHGLIAAVRADARGRSVGGAMVQRPWEGRWSDYRLRDGMRVPMRGEVAWLLPPSEGGRKPYWRGTITGLHYTFMRRGGTATGT